MFEYIVGLDVKDDDLYSEYRKNMMPILESFRGGFRYDFRIEEVLKTQSEEHINRVFTIYFPNKKTADEFFSDSIYLKVKEEFFDKAVRSTTIIAESEK